jgi:hypothetical protein
MTAKEEVPADLHHHGDNFFLTTDAAGLEPAARQTRIDRAQPSIHRVPARTFAALGSYFMAWVAYSECWRSFSERGRLVSLWTPTREWSRVVGPAVSLLGDNSAGCSAALGGAYERGTK